ncbi:DnaB-like helicase C-terminal domain-containing protein [Acinetobacter bereziniae]|uniref:DnaB-like helicase C-terminal domain-containing protein n=1 Tax=Acinetobacter bereziniae TaxID=106648 RepID=UPI0020916320|nr:DnaB-like helicase C-terminal domain-containing protein [Acinetobacter bereziniae]
MHHYLKKLQDLTLRRQLLDAGNRIQKIANDLSNGEADDAIARASSALSDISTGNSDEDPEPLINSMIDLFDEINKIQSEKLNGTYAVRGVNTGFIALDNKIGEIQKGDLVIIAARPSMGKTFLFSELQYSRFSNVSNDNWNIFKINC